MAASHTKDELFADLVGHLIETSQEQTRVLSQIQCQLAENTACLKEMNKHFTSEIRAEIASVKDEVRRNSPAKVISYFAGSIVAVSGLVVGILKYLGA